MCQIRTLQCMMSTEKSEPCISQRIYSQGIRERLHACDVHACMQVRCWLLCSHARVADGERGLGGRQRGALQQTGLARGVLDGEQHPVRGLAAPGYPCTAHRMLFWLLVETPKRRNLESSYTLRTVFTPDKELKGGNTQEHNLSSSCTLRISPLFSPEIPRIPFQVQVQHDDCSLSAVTLC